MKEWKRVIVRQMVLTSGLKVKRQKLNLRGVLREKQVTYHRLQGHPSWSLQSSHLNLPHHRPMSQVLPNLRRASTVLSAHANSSRRGRPLLHSHLQCLLVYRPSLARHSRKTGTPGKVLLSRLRPRQVSWRRILLPNRNSLQESKRIRTATLCRKSQVFC